MPHQNKEQIPVDLRSQVSFYNHMLRDHEFFVDRFKQSRDKLRNLSKRFTKEGFITSRKEGRFFVCKLKPEQKTSFVALINERNYHVRKYLDPELLHLPKSAQQTENV